MRMREFVLLSICLLSTAETVCAATRNHTLRIKILDSQTRSVTLDDSLVPINCDGLNYDAYCHSAKTTEVTNIVVAQEENGAPFRMSCTVETKWSKCTALPVGESFEARREKNGVVVYFADQAGKPRKQLYAVLDSLPTHGTTDAEISAAQSAAPATDRPEETPHAQDDKTPAMPSDSRQKTHPAVRCSFTSTPAGAAIFIDGHFAGSTPSVVALTAGTHTLTVSIPGYARWAQALSVSEGSDLTVNAILKKEK